MKAKFLAMSLLSAAFATTVAFADNASTSSAPVADTPAMSGQQAPAPADSSANTNASSSTMSGTGATQ